MFSGSSPKSGHLGALYLQDDPSWEPNHKTHWSISRKWNQKSRFGEFSSIGNYMKFIGVKHRFPKLWPDRWSIRTLFLWHPNFGVQDDHHLGPPSPGNPPNFRYFRNFVLQTVAFWRLILSRPASSVSPRSRDHRGSTVSFDRSEKSCLSRKISSPKAHRVGQIFAKMWEFCMISRVPAAAIAMN